MAATKIFVNIAVKDLERSKAFYQKLGYAINPKFSDDTGACVVISDDIYVMILTEAKFQAFTPKPLADPRRSTEAIVALSAPSRAEVDRIVRTALASGGREHTKPNDLGFMYQWSFEDPDGHIWETFWMDPVAAEQGPPPA